MTKPNSTDAGGVTHLEAYKALQGLWRVAIDAPELLTLKAYIDTQEAALATLTRENAELKTRCFTDCNCAPYHMADCPARHANEQHSPPEGSAPLPGGQGQVEALRREIVEALREIEVDWPDGFRALADRLEHK